jgi:O-antigen/teichoic acid export membrane protein
MVRNIFSNWMGLIITGVISFALTPILIHGLGDFYFGMWILTTSILDYYGLLDLGIRTTLHRFVGRLKGMNEREALDGFGRAE